MHTRTHKYMVAMTMLAAGVDYFITVIIFAYY